jgi:hypothetical protein
MGRFSLFIRLLSRGISITLDQALSYRLESPVAFLKRLIDMAYGLSPVSMEFFRSRLELMLRLLEMLNRRLDSRMMLRSRTCRGRVGSGRSSHGRLRRRRLRVES